MIRARDIVKRYRDGEGPEVRVLDGLSLDVEAGELVVLGTATGTFKAYGHAVTLSTLGYSFDVVVYFAGHEGFGRNVLGRRGWRDRVRLGLVDYEGKLYLSRYED